MLIRPLLSLAIGLPIVLAALFMGSCASDRPAAGSAVPAGSHPALLVAGALRCEYLTEPLAIDRPTPRLSWELTPVYQHSRNLVQRSYRILVADSASELAREHGTLWDSGRVDSAATNQVEYRGAALTPRQRAYWCVMVWDGDGTPSGWSKPATWTAGLLDAHGWGSARWIADATPPPAQGLDALPSPTLRREFTCGTGGATVVRATLSVTALGLYEVSINGKRVGTHELAPEWTDYTKRVQYQAYDVTALLSAGKNCVGAMLGDGWYAGKIGLTGIVPNGPARAIYGRQPQLLLRLDVTLSDGSACIIVSDDEWKSTLDGPMRTADLLDGVTYDAQKAEPGWSKPGFVGNTWKPVRVCDAPTITVVAQANEPVRVTREITPIKVFEPKPGVYVADMGQNMVGWCRLRVSGPRGNTVTVRHAEMLNPDGTIYTTNLRGAAQTDRYILGGGADELFEPRFTYHGFRYVEITGLESKPSPDAIIGRVANSDCPEVGEFACSDPDLNRLWQNIRWTQRSNLIGVPTDCPQRDERCGWMGDILAFAPTANFNMDMAAFYTKWIPDTRDAQAKDGRFADISPHPYEPDKRFSGVPAWGDAGVFVPWEAYRFYGDARILADQYDAAVRWVEYIRAKNPDLLWTNSRGNDYGDWLNADTLKLQGWPAKGAEVPKHVFASMFFYRSTWIVSEMAGVLGKSDDAKKYSDLAGAIRDAFVKAYVSADGTIEGDTQAGYALALQFGLLPERLQENAAKKMVERFKPYGGQISTGFHSTLPLMTQLTKHGYNDDAYRLVLNKKMPSWGYEVAHGATTIWERWDGFVEGRGFQDPGMNSFSHYAIGAVGEWMYTSMLGIQPVSPGFASIKLCPKPGPGIKAVRGSYRSIRGTISSAWERTPGGLRMRFELPPGMTAEVTLPTADVKAVTENTVPLDGPRSKIPWRLENGTIVCTVGSGSYDFLVRP